MCALSQLPALLRAAAGQLYFLVATFFFSFGFLIESSIEWKGKYKIFALQCW